jgi:hypothetical protein
MQARTRAPLRGGDQDLVARALRTAIPKPRDSLDNAVK